MQWDIFCKVIDNHGDLGVCWRLASQLASAGQHVRLWIDDAAALRWMAPGGREGVEVIAWLDEEAVSQACAAPSPDVLIEAFGCDPAPALVARFAQPLPDGSVRHAWINLEYLSAEPYVERLHGLPSPVFRGPGEGLTKRFFYPGFTPGTGGLLREPDLMVRRGVFDRVQWLAGQGIGFAGERLISLFCYEPPALEALLSRLAADARPTRLLVTSGRAAAAVRKLVRSGEPQGSLTITYLPYLTQDDFDRMLWSCDLNFVRGEDSLVRALWAGAPLVWQIYPQDDDAHHEKLNAWLDWMQAPASLRAFHHAWNGFGPAAPAPLEMPDSWSETTLAARGRLLEQQDLLTQLRQRVAGKS